LKTHRLILSVSLVLLVTVILIGFGVGVTGTSLPRAKLPLMITSCGQSPDALMIKLLCDQLRMTTTFEKTLLPEQLEGYSTLIIGIGGSVKGLGEAGIDTDEEIDRINRVIQRARQQNMLVLAIHIGGQPRRGDLADPFIHAAAPQSDYIIVRNDGNQDGLFTKIATENRIPIITIEQTMELKDLIEQMFEL
jgi:hypothetical protein